MVNTAHGLFDQVLCIRFWNAFTYFREKQHALTQDVAVVLARRHLTEDVLLASLDTGGDRDRARTTLTSPPLSRRTTPTPVL
jgi:hypothetical protein